MKILFSPCWVGEPARVTRNQKWLKYHLDIKEELGFDKIILIDNASPLGELHKLKANLYNENCNVLYRLPERSDVLIYRMNDHLPRTGIWEYPYCWRALMFLKILIARLNIDKIIFLDSDFYVLSKKLAHFLRDQERGWTSFFCHKYGFPEAALHVLTAPDLWRFQAFPIADPFCYNGKHMEWLLPFTQVLKTEFKGDRYGEECLPQPLDADYYGQWNTGCPDMMYEKCADHVVAEIKKCPNEYWECAREIKKLKAENDKLSTDLVNIEAVLGQVKEERDALKDALSKYEGSTVWESQYLQSLNKENESLKKQIQRLCQEIKEGDDLQGKSDERIKALRETLDWYSDGIYPGDESEITPGNFRSGKRARIALAQDDKAAE